jgi:hypothetical protein
MPMQPRKKSTPTWVELVFRIVNDGVGFVASKNKRH